MFPKNVSSPYQKKRGYIYGSPQDFLNRLPAEVLNSLTEEQLTAIYQMLEKALPKSSPKLVYIRWTINLIFVRYYLVFLVGRDPRTYKRYRFINRATKIGNTIAYIVLLSLVSLIFSYIFKSFLGIDLFPEKHLDDFIGEFLSSK